MPRQVLCLSAWLAAALLLASARLRAVTFTSSLPVNATNIIGPAGAVVSVTLPEGHLDDSGLPDNEHIADGSVSREYRWSIPGVGSGIGRTATLPAATPPGIYTVSFTGCATYRVGWHENGAAHTDGPFSVPLTPAAGGQLTATVRLVGVASLSCGGVTSATATPGAAETLVLPRGFNNGSVTVAAAPSPAGDWPTGKPEWSGVASDEGATATIDTTVLGTRTVTATCGNSVSLLVHVAGVDIRGDVNHDGQVNQGDEAILPAQGAAPPAELETCDPGVLLAVPSPDDTPTLARGRFAPLHLVTEGIAALAALPGNQTANPADQPKLTLSYDPDILEIFDSDENGSPIASGSSLAIQDGTTVVYARARRASGLSNTNDNRTITLKFHSILQSFSDSLVFTALDVTPSMPNGGYILVNDDNDDMLIYPANATSTDRLRPANTQMDSDQTAPQTWEDDELLNATFPFAIQNLAGTTDNITVSFAVEGAGGANVYSDDRKNVQVLNGQNHPPFSVSLGSNGLQVTTGDTPPVPLSTTSNTLSVAIEGTSRSGSEKGTRVVATWKVNQVELKAVLPLTILQVQMAVDGGKHGDAIPFTDFGNGENNGNNGRTGDFGNYRCVFWLNTDYDNKHFQNEFWPEQDAWLEDDCPLDKDADGTAIPQNYTDDHIGWRGKRRRRVHDGGGHSGNYVWQSPSAARNYCLRDLEDFNRLHMRFDPLLESMADASFTLQGDHVTVNLFRAVKTDLSYLSNVGDADKQAKEKRLLTIGGTAVQLGDEITFGTESVTAFLWEGCPDTSTPPADSGFILLYVHVGQHLVGKKKVQVILKDVSDFYDVWNSSDVSNPQVLGGLLQAMRGSNAHCFPAASDDYLLICHGFNVNATDKAYWPGTAFKRLWWLGYKGRMGFFSWPCKVRAVDGTYAKIYDDSDQVAWDTGEILKELLEGLKDNDFTVHLLAHSQGNVVAGSALRQLDPAKKISTYIATQGAISISCYKECQEAYFLLQKCPDVRADYPGWSAGGPFLATVKNKVDRMANFYNAVDYALESMWFFSWKRNNSMRPDFDYDYEGSSTVYDENPSSGTPSRFYNSAGAVLPTDQTDLHFPSPPANTQSSDLEDTHEIFSYAAHAWGEPIGMLADVPDFAAFNLSQGPLSYDEHHYSHSRQFRSNHPAEQAYWLEVISKCLNNR